MLVVLVIVAAIAFSGSPQSTQSGSTQNATDYSSYYNTAYGTHGVVVTSFYKTTSDNGNDLYVGVVRNFSSPQSEPNTITLEICTSQSQAAQIYQTAVTNATNAGYVARTTAPVFNHPITQGWQGDNAYNDYKMIAYYQDANVGNAWVVETQYM